MRKGSLSQLLTLVVLALGTVAYAASPVLSPLPVIVISDEENNSGTVDYNVFVFSEAFSFSDYVEDTDSPANTLLWSFYYDAALSGNVGSITINDVGPLANVGNASAPGASAISFAGATYVPEASFRETTLTPGSGPVGAPLAAPATEISSNTDENLDGYNDRLVGELAVTFFVADAEGNTDSADTMVLTIDTNPLGVGAPLPAFGPATTDGTTPRTTPLQAGGLGDALVDATGIPTIAFQSSPFDLLETGDTALGTNEWVFLDWDAVVGPTGSVSDWLWNNTSATLGAGPTVFDALINAGARQGSPTLSAFRQSFGDWSNQGSPLAQYEPGNIYAIRASLGWRIGSPNTAAAKVKTADESYNIYSRENTIGALSQSYSVTAQVGDASPFLVAANSTKAYQLTADPPDAERLRLPGTPASASNPNLFYTVGYDYTNRVDGGNLIDAILSNFEIGGVARSVYEANETGVVAFGSTAGDVAFNGSVNPHLAGWTGWKVEIEGTQLLGFRPELTNIIAGWPTSGVTIAAGSITAVVPAGNLTTGFPFIRISNFGDRIASGANWVDEGQPATNDVGSIDGIIADAVYLNRYTLTNTPAATGRAQVNVNNTYYYNAFTVNADLFGQRAAATAGYTGNNGEIDMHFTAATQFATLPSGPPAGSEEALRSIISFVNGDNLSSTVVLTRNRLILLGENDPNVDY